MSPSRAVFLSQGLGLALLALACANPVQQPAEGSKTAGWRGQTPSPWRITHNEGNPSVELNGKHLKPSLTNPSYNHAFATTQEISGYYRVPSKVNELLEAIFNAVASPYTANPETYRDPNNAHRLRSYGFAEMVRVYKTNRLGQTTVEIGDIKGQQLLLPKNETNSVQGVLSQPLPDAVLELNELREYLALAAMSLPPELFGADTPSPGCDNNVVLEVAAGINVFRIATDSGDSLELSEGPHNDSTKTAAVPVVYAAVKTIGDHAVPQGVKLEVYSNEVLDETDEKRKERATQENFIQTSKDLDTLLGSSGAAIFTIANELFAHGTYTETPSSATDSQPAKVGVDVLVLTFRLAQ